MSDDALAALLAEVMREIGSASDGFRSNARWLAARGVVVLSPAVAEVLRTGEPSEALEKAMRLAIWRAATFTKVDLNTAEGRSALALNAAATAARAALAVLRGGKW